MVIVIFCGDGDVNESDEKNEGVLCLGHVDRDHVDQNSDHNGHSLDLGHSLVLLYLDRNIVVCVVLSLK
jgi:hypothetical protein